MSTDTFWNGEPCEARRVGVIVADNAAFPEYWARPFVGQRRAAVEVTYNGETFYIDDEGYDESPETYEWIRERARGFAATMGIGEEEAFGRLGVKAEQEDGSHLRVGYPGHGWAKVTEGRGSPRYAHASLSIERPVQDVRGD